MTNIPSRLSIFWQFRTRHLGLSFVGTVVHSAYLAGVAIIAVANVAVEQRHAAHPLRRIPEDHGALVADRRTRCLAVHGERVVSRNGQRWGGGHNEGDHSDQFFHGNILLRRPNSYIRGT